MRTLPSRHRFVSILLGWVLLLTATGEAAAQIRVHPTGVNVSASGPTVVFLTYGGLGNYVPDQAQWCGELVDAFPEFGQRCHPATLFGQLPLRHDLSQASGQDGFTDIMTIPASVARRAYQQAQSGVDSRFFYVRRFVDPFGGGPAVYVAVTCRLAGGGARVPFALLDVQMAFAIDTPVLSVRHGETLPTLSAEISYNGTGRLVGRWEIVLPGEEPPTARDLLTEATLPIEERGLQRRYTELDRFSLFLPPSAGARFVLPGPDPSRLPTAVDGLYLVLLRIEAVDDKEGDTDLSAVGAGTGVVHTGAVAGFPIPPIRYFVGGASSVPAVQSESRMYQIIPEDGFSLAAGGVFDFSWTEAPHAVLYRLEIEDLAGQSVLSALLPPGITTYRAPPWLGEKAGGRPMQWRVSGLTLGGRVIAGTAWRSLGVRVGDTP